MARRRGRGTVVVDLVETADAGTPPADPGAPDERASRPGMSRRQRIVQIAVAVVVIAAVAAGLGVTSAVREHARLDRLRHAPGGVLSLDAPPRPVWTVDDDAFAPVQYLPGVVVRQRPDDVVGLDSATGTERWTVPFRSGDAALCGTWGFDLSQVGLVQDSLTCLRGNGDAAGTLSVVVLDAGGLVAKREVGGPFDSIWPAWGDGLLTVRLVGPEPAPPTMTQDLAGNWTTGPVEHGYDALVRLEDAATGATRWEVTVPFRPVEELGATWPCLAGDGASRPVFQPKTLSTRVDPAVFTLTGCGLQATITGAGVVLDDGRSTDGGGSVPGMREPYADGGILSWVSSSTTPSGVAGSVLYGTDGSTIQSFDEPLLDPMATDGTDTGVRLVGGAEKGLAAVDADGHERWRVELAAEGLLTRAGGVAAVVDAAGVVTGLDLRTGATLWTSRELARFAPGGNVDPTTYLAGAYTDGRTMLVAASPSPDPSDGGLDLVALDLRTGATRWKDEHDGYAPRLVAVDGGLVLTVATDVTRESVEGGMSITFQGETVSALR